MPNISIIVPVYNTASYLVGCIDSILAQSFADFELILVDDGSTDESSAICEEAVVRDSRIRCYHQANQGQQRAVQYLLAGFLRPEAEIYHCLSGS